MLRHARILIVESNPFAALDLQRTLHGMGCKAPIVVPTGEEAIRLTDTAKFSVVLMELDLKGAVKGKEAAKIIQERSHASVIFMTADAERDVLETTLASNPFACLLKPMRKCILQMAIEQSLQAQNAEAGVDIACLMRGAFKKVECGNMVPLTIVSMGRTGSVVGQVEERIPRSLEAMGYALEGYWVQRRNCGSRDYFEPHFEVGTPSASTRPACGHVRDQRQERESSEEAIDCIGLSEVCRSADGSTYEVPRLKIRIVSKGTRLHRR
jgi:CheY-like chemotaxis protein